MTGWQILGAVMFAAPFVGMFAYTVREMGWREAAIIHLAIVALCAFMFVASYLLAGDA